MAKRRRTKFPQQALDTHFGILIDQINTLYLEASRSGEVQGITVANIVSTWDVLADLMASSGARIVFKAPKVRGDGECLN